MKQHKTILPNGLTVITVEKPHSYTVATGISVNAGSFNEVDFPAGTAHFLEHMIFKETTTRTNKEINNGINSIGGLLNAFTYYEETKYYAVTPKHAWGLGAELLMDVLANNTIPEREVDKERNVIFEEIKMYKDDPTSLILDALQQKMLESLPERHSIIGTEETVSKITREDIVRFRDTYYHPENMTFIVVGAVTHEEVLAQVKSFTIPYARQTETPKRSFAPSELTGRERIVENTEQSHFTFSLFGPSIQDADLAAFEVLNVVLGGNESSRMFEKIREDKGIAYFTKTNTEYLSDYGAMYGLIGTSEEYFDEVEEIIEKEMVDLSENGITEEELIRAKAYIIGNAMMEYESNAEINDYISSAFIYGQDSDPQTYIEEIENLTKEDVKRVAEKYFTLDNFLVLTLIGEESEEEEEAV